MSTRKTIPTINDVKDSKGAEIPNHGKTLDTVVGISGFASANQKVEVIDNGVAKGLAVAGVNGVWVLQLTGLSLGSHVITAKSEGLVSPPRTFTVVPG